MKLPLGMTTQFFRKKPETNQRLDKSRVEKSERHSFFYFSRFGAAAFVGRRRALGGSLGIERNGGLAEKGAGR
jgi:hypothetical protein